MFEKIILSTRETSGDIYKEQQAFERIIINVPNSKFAKSHMLDSTNKIKADLREYLYNALDVSNSHDMISMLGSGWVLVVNDGISDPVVSSENKTVEIYYDDFEMFYKDKKNLKDTSKTVKDLFDDEKNPSTANISRIIRKISERSKELSFTDKEKAIVSESIPSILTDNNIRLTKDDIFDINRVEVEEIIEIGRMILKKDKRVCNKLGIKDVSKENAWQRYFEKYGTYLLFGSIELDPQVCLDKDKTKELNDKKPDILTRNRYGFIDIIELKKSDEPLFKFDSSHNKFVPTPYLSGALSQLNGYLQIIPYAFNVEDAKKQSLECASGMLIIGNSENLIKSTSDLRKWIQENHKSEDDLKFMVRQELRKLNYSYSHMQVVLYDELIDTLEQFINNIR